MLHQSTPWWSLTAAAVADSQMPTTVYVSKFFLRFALTAKDVFSMAISRHDVRGYSCGHVLNSHGSHCIIDRSSIVRPCKFGTSLLGLAFSTPAIWSVSVRPFILRPLIFSAPKLTSFLHINYGNCLSLSDAPAGISWAIAVMPWMLRNAGPHVRSTIAFSSL